MMNVVDSMRDVFAESSKIHNKGSFPRVLQTSAESFDTMFRPAEDNPGFFAIPRIDDSNADSTQSSSNKVLGYQTASEASYSKDSYTSVIEIFEGVVQSVDRKEQVMTCSLRSVKENTADHIGEFSLEWVHAQDIDLVVPGAVFYLSLYKEKFRGTLRNTEEIRFRRLPAWSKVQVDKIKQAAERLGSKIRTKPQAE